MIIYEQEQLDGLEAAMANRSVAYCAQIKPSYPRTSPEDLAKIRAKYPNASGATASMDNFDLYPVTSLLVSTTFNLNDDMFGPIPTYAARHTPEDKPFNFEHRPTDIIGHIVSNVVVDDQMNPVPDDLADDQIPDKFHIITNSVIYKNLNDPEYMDRISKIIPEIENGDWYVSMECLFSDFDYAMKSVTGTINILPRNETTAFLSKHLRAYGGNGRYQGYTIGRYLKNITFSGHGLVETPANPESIIFSDVRNFSEASKLVYIESIGHILDMEKPIMADEVKNQDALVDKLNKEIDSLRAQLSDVNVQATKAERDKLEGELTVARDALTKAASDLKDALAKVDALTADLDNERTESAKVKKEMNDMKKAQCKANRLTKLSEVIADRTEAEKLVDQFENLTDEQFDAFVAVAMTWKQAGAQQNVVQYPQTSAASVEEDAEEVVDTATPTGDQTTGNTTSDVSVDAERIEATRAAVAEYFQSDIAKTRKRK